MNLRRFDTLFLRLFLLMWLTLAASHFTAFMITMNTLEPPNAHRTLDQRLEILQPLPSLPPGNPFTSGELTLPPPAFAQAPRPGQPRGLLWRDYAIRMLVIGIGAWIGARWLAAPMRRLTAAASDLSQRLERGDDAPHLDAHRGTHEVRAMAAVFNRMARRLQEQFDLRGFQMAAVSHDLRTPLTRLRMRLESLPREPLTQSAIADVREMDELIDGALAVLREQRDGTEPSAVDAHALLQSICDDLVEQGHDVTLDAPPAGLRVRARPAALRRVLGNLVGNALRYGGRARLALVGTAERVEIMVDDDGPGIPPDELEHVFQPWVRLDAARSRAGDGLGLAIARNLAERDGGSIKLENLAGAGLRATLRMDAG